MDSVDGLIKKTDAVDGWNENIIMWLMDGVNRRSY